MKRERIYYGWLGALMWIAPLSAEEIYTAWAADYTGKEPHTLLLWKFDSPAPDRDASGNDNAVTFSPTGVKMGIAGKFGDAFLSEQPYTEESSHFAQGGSSFNAFLGVEMSVEFWYRPLSSSPSDGRKIAYFFDKMYADKTGMLLALSCLSDKENALLLSVGNGEKIASAVTESLDWNPEQWYHLAVTYKNKGGMGILRIFRDGEELARAEVRGFGDLVSGERNYRLANRLGSIFSSVPGYYDNFRVSEVAYNYGPND